MQKSIQMNQTMKRIDKADQERSLDNSEGEHHDCHVGEGRAGLMCCFHDVVSLRHCEVQTLEHISYETLVDWVGT
jgi:hypothetical protein